MEKGEAGVDKVFTGFNCTDMGNAKRFIALFGENIRYCAELKTWLLWTGIVWAKDSLGGVIELAKSDPRMAIKANQLDANPYLINCPDSTLELKKRVFRPHDKDDLCT